MNRSPGCESASSSSFGNADLWCGQADATFLVHRIKHIFDQPEQSAVKVRDFGTASPQYWIAYL
jgi:hypothetical protein